MGCPGLTVQFCSLLHKLQFMVGEHVNILRFMVQFSPFGHYFASCSHDRTARIWGMDRVQPLRIMAGHLSDVDVSVSLIFIVWVLICKG